MRLFRVDLFIYRLLSDIRFMIIRAAAAHNMTSVAKALMTHHDPLKITLRKYCDDTSTSWTTFCINMVMLPKHRAG